MFGCIQKGIKCHLRFGGNRVPAEVLDVREQLIRLRCPENGVPTRGKGITIELKEQLGVAGFFAQVVTAAPGDLHEIVLMRAPGLDRVELRAHLRVPASLKAMLRGNQRGAPLEVDIINVSTGGVLVETESNLDVGDKVQLVVTGDESMSLTFAGAVVHTCVDQSTNRQHVGIRFLGPDEACHQALSWYVWKRVEQVFPAYAGV